MQCCVPVLGLMSLSLGILPHTHSLYLWVTLRLTEELLKMNMYGHHSSSPTFLCLPRFMDCIAQQVLVLRRPSKSLQQVWCPTKLSRLQPQMQLQLQPAVQLRMRSRVTKFRESSDNALLPFDCTFFSSYCIL